MMNEKTAYQVFDELRVAYGMSVYTVCKETGISTSYMTQWKQGKINPKQDKLQKLADFFNVPLTYFYPDAQLDDYYVDPEATAIAQKLASTPGAKTLLDAFCDMPKEDAEFILQMVEKLTSK